MRVFFLESTFGTLIFALVNNTSWNMNVKSFLTKSRKREKRVNILLKNESTKICYHRSPCLRVGFNTWATFYPSGFGA